MFQKIVAFPLICMATYFAITAILPHSAVPAQQQVPASASASSSGVDTTTGGSWRSTYGTDGYDLSQDASGPNPSIPAYASLTVIGESNYTWASSPSDPRALDNAAGTGRLAACWYTTASAIGASFDIGLNITDGQSHRVTLYAVDYETDNTRSQRYDVIDAATGAVLHSETISNFSQGEYVSWDVTGGVIIRVTSLAANLNAVVSGVFFDTLIPVSPVSDGTVTFVNLAADGTLAVPGSTIPVRATLNFYDLTVDQPLTWFLEVSSAVADPDGTYPVVWTNSYDAQGFTVPMGQTATPNFAEDVVVQPGIYYVRCGVKELRGGADFAICEGTFLVNVTP
jgi:hypothetical protein